MAIEKVYVSDGVPQATFNSHTHNYRKLTQIGADADDKWGSPKWVDIVDESDVHINDGYSDLEAVGVTVATLPTSVPL